NDSQCFTHQLPPVERQERGVNADVRETLGILGRGKPIWIQLQLHRSYRRLLRDQGSSHRRKECRRPACPDWRWTRLLWRWRGKGRLREGAILDYRAKTGASVQKALREIWRHFIYPRRRPFRR